MKKKFLPLLLLCGLPCLLSAQSFTKVTTGSIVNTPSDSRSVNWIDFNNDGWHDLMITNGPQAGANNMLYKNNGDGTFTEITGDPIVTDNKPSDGATWADQDNDGFIDCFVVNWYNVSNLFYTNNGDETFTYHNDLFQDGGFSETASWGDYDNDGLVDLYVTNSEGNKKNFLYHNDGGGVFTKVVAGSIVNDAYYSRSINWIDYDNDNDQDVFVSNEENQHENLYNNDGEGNFTPVTAINLLQDGGNTMSSSWGDYDNDGDFDVFLANNQGYCSLFRNDGNDSFTKMTTDIVGNTFSQSFGSNWGDVNNDGFLDLYVTNSFGSGPHQNFLFMNNGDGSFTRNTTSPAVQEQGWSYGCAFGDYDNDGFLDLAVANCYNASQSNSLFHNDGNSNNWLAIGCTGVVSNQSAIGTKVKIKVFINGQPTWLLREISAQSGYCGQNMLTVHFGIGTATNVDSVRIEWPSGILDIYEDINVNQRIFALEGQQITGTKEPVMPVLTTLSNYPNPFSDSTLFEFELKKEAAIELAVFDLKGNKLAKISSGRYNSGIHNIAWNGELSNGQHLPPGVYVISLIVNKEVISKKLTCFGK
jgi:hypothetical protein